MDKSILPLLALRMGNLSVIGATITQTIDGTERTVDCTAGLGDYPMTVRVKARAAGCYLAQGGAAVALDPTAADNFDLSANEYVFVTIGSADTAFFAVEQSSVDTGVLAVTRVDEVL